MSSESISECIAGVSGATRVVGVFGYPVEHSRSPAMHNAAFVALQLPYIYVPFPVPPDSIGAAIRSLPALGIVGVNLTIPHKESVLPYLDAITEEARDVGAVNTVRCVEGKLVGDNTDGFGFYEPLRERGFEAKGKRVIVLGAGGAARSVVFRLLREGAQVTLTNRTPERAVRLAEDAAKVGLGGIETVAHEDTPRLREAMGEAQLLVQTTRVGMYPDVNALPALPLEALHRNLLVYDLVYNPVETQLLRAAQQRGCRTLTGIKMLVYQGAAAFRLWTGVWPPTELMEAAVLEGLREKG